ncbi:queD-like protein [Shewanella sp. 202IG2-18]|uniref:VC2046/SO_2500 family protein n=1 Tax=Parashewanella hymeniacidonis TaxID=2807618 RepID=UPI00195FCC40|nr:VC2046/SO_2500 family protein [Parashewanella hymeniacidonis]MBM7074055.1 queD-like protein [Parashewanella hymeniacidonis]
MQIERVLKNELDIGLSLNKAAETNRRGDFALILALLSQDVRDMAQFELINGIDLRVHFELHHEARLEENLSTESGSKEHSEVFHTQGHIEFRLRESLNPEPLVFRGEVPSPIQRVLENCDLLTINRYKNIEEVKPKNMKLAFIDQLQQQRTMAKLIQTA